MTPDTLRRAGLGLYGDRWQAYLARDLVVDRRTVARWLAGEYQIPRRAMERLSGIILQRLEYLEDVDKAIDEAMESGHDPHL